MAGADTHSLIHSLMGTLPMGCFAAPSSHTQKTDREFCDETV